MESNNTQKSTAHAEFAFPGARVLVTGGSNGMGLAIARRFTEAGADVTITGTRPSAAEYDADLSGFTYRQCVLSDGDQIDAVAAELDGLDVLVNNAGQNHVMENEWDPETFEKSLMVNLAGAFRMANRCLPLLRKSELEGGAAVVNVASMTSYFAVGVVPGYGAAKAGVVQMTMGMAVEWAKEGIRANAIAPGLTATNMTAGLQSRPEHAQPSLDRTPMGRWAEPYEDIAPVVLFLASPAARFVTGQTLPVDGGFTVQG